MENIQVDVIIPAYHPAREFELYCSNGSTEQDSPMIHRIIVNEYRGCITGIRNWDEKYPLLEVHHIRKGQSLTMAAHEQEGGRTVGGRHYGIYDTGCCFRRTGICFGI